MKYDTLNYWDITRVLFHHNVCTNFLTITVIIQYLNYDILWASLGNRQAVHVYECVQWYSTINTFKSTGCSSYYAEIRLL
jgi:hypothetical protein